jgi:hypothetical protein
VERAVTPPGHCYISAADGTRLRATDDLVAASEARGSIVLLHWLANTAVATAMSRSA